MDLWPHQKYALTETKRHMEAGCKRILVTSPTGGGKSLVMFNLAQMTPLGVVIYSNRKMLTDQLIEGAKKNRVQVGVRAAEYGDKSDIKSRVQIASIQTEYSRVIKGGAPHVFAHYAIVDEAHMQKGEMANKVFDLHEQDLGIRIGFTATPLGVGHLYDELVVAGVNSELRKCGSHLPCKVFSPSQFDIASLKSHKIGEDYSSGELKEIWTKEIYGNVIEHHRRLNPDFKPALLMAPGVKQAVWMAQQYEGNGIPAASVDGDEIWFRGERWKSSRKNREKVNDALVSGDIKVICNRFVYREAVDIPELYHLILACPIGSLLSYVQTVGRVLRNHPSLDHVIVQDHGGNAVMHGSPNEDRNWEKYWKLDPTTPTKDRMNDLKDPKPPDDGEPKAKEPICCPKCRMERAKGYKCPNCGEQSNRSVRLIWQKNGSLREHKGDLIQKRRESNKPEDVKKWERVYYRMKNSGKTFAQARGLFAHENMGLFPGREFPLMPKSDIDMHRKIRDVPREDLYG